MYTVIYYIIMESIYREPTEKLHNEQLKIFDQVLLSHDDITLLIGDSVLELFVRQIKFRGMGMTLPPNYVVLAKGGDRIQHLLWRLEHTPDSEKVKKIILHIGTNNLSSKKSVDPIAAGCIQVMEILKRKYPKAHITFISLYQREDIVSEKVCELNKKIRENIPDRCSFDSDVWIGILPPDDRYHKEFYTDNVHLNRSSYQLLYSKLISIN